MRTEGSPDSAEGVGPSLDFSVSGSFLGSSVMAARASGFQLRLEEAKCGEENRQVCIMYSTNKFSNIITIHLAFCKCQPFDAK